MTRAVVRWLSAFSLIICVGCGASGGASNRPPTYPVTGTVKLNGKPVEGAVVTFQPMEGKTSSIGNTDAQGKYELSTYGSADGAPEGQYKVTITKYDVPVTPPPNAGTPGQLGAPGLPDDYAPPTTMPTGGGKSGPKNALPAKYANGDTSALRATVDKGKNTFDYDLK